MYWANVELEQFCKFITDLSFKLCFGLINYNVFPQFWLTKNWFEHYKVQIWFIANTKDAWKCIKKWGIMRHYLKSLILQNIQLQYFRNTFLLGKYVNIKQ